MTEGEKTMHNPSGGGASYGFAITLLSLRDIFPNREILVRLYAYNSNGDVHPRRGGFPRPPEQVWISHKPNDDDKPRRGELCSPAGR